MISERELELKRLQNKDEERHKQITREIANKAVTRVAFYSALAFVITVILLA